MDTMYPGKINSPATTLSSGITDIVTTIPLTDASVVPAAPNLAVIGTGEDAETILYTGKSANDLTSCTRGFQGTAKAWDSGTAVARFFTAYDYDTLRTNLDAHDPATTGVHGVGANHLAEAPAAGHLVRGFSKGWTAGKLLKGAGVDADPTERASNFDLFIEGVPYILYPWRNIDRFTLTVSGSGAGSFVNLVNYTLDTGATSGSVARLTSDDGFYLPFKQMFAFEINPRSAAYTDSEIWIAFMQTPGTPSLTQRHQGWRILNGRIYATCGNGTNGTQVDTGLDLSQYSNKKFVFQRSASDIKYYVAGVLEATITTNRPTGGSGYINLYVKNNVAASRHIWVSSFMFQEVSL